MPIFETELVELWRRRIRIQADSAEEARRILKANHSIYGDTDDLIPNEEVIEQLILADDFIALEESDDYDAIEFTEVEE